MTLQFGPRRGIVLNAQDELDKFQFSEEEVKHFEFFDLVYRALCAIMFNYVPTSGHPGGSISSGRFVARLLFDTMAYDISNPDAEEADIISYAAGHKALGLYALWALRNEVVRQGESELLPKDEKYQLRLEDLLGFRRNPVTKTPLFLKYKSKPLDGHPTPVVPFVKVATGPSGYGIAMSGGLALGALDFYGKDNPPCVHVIEGEGGMTAGRVSEALAFAATAGLKNFIFHLDWNQASIDSNHVTRNGAGAGDYVQWDPIEFCHLHDLNVIIAPDGLDLKQIFTAQKLLSEIKNDQPTAIIYRTIKGWKYGIEGKASHGAGHKFCSEGYYAALRELETLTGASFPRFDGEQTSENIEKYYWETLLVIRKILEQNKETVNFLARKIKESQERLRNLKRQPRSDAPRVEAVYNQTKFKVEETPELLRLKIGETTTLRGVLSSALNYYNKASGGALMVGAADLYDSTSVNKINHGFAEGFFHANQNPLSRLLSVGGICEDAIGGVAAGLSAFGRHIGVGSSYAAFIAALQHTTMRIHGIGQQMRVRTFGGQYNPFIVICGHAGLKTGEDGPTHADPQPLQMLQENFPTGLMITLIPWDPQEIWPLITAALQARPAVIAPFVTRPNEKVLDRNFYHLPPAHAAAQGIYAFRRAPVGRSQGTIVLQGSAVTYNFVEHVLPRLDAEGLQVDIFYVASVELFDQLPSDEKEEIFPEALRQQAMGITDFTLPTLYRFVTSERGRAASLYPFKNGHYTGSGQGAVVLREAGLDGESQHQAVMAFLKRR